MTYIDFFENNNNKKLGRNDKPSTKIFHWLELYFPLKQRLLSFYVLYNTSYICEMLYITSNSMNLT